ncbi:DUF3375 family protein [Tahibacter harae]|uniref:DUF3375 family protein n=1 Tax=Tahibacter harae TaxID=2963937 RepID=A0ABT1QV77_9GAMM|nr:DUF3375 family protein [Tahibacter harae]MCQ4166197.1 DUF3375 family protein [Tahibacter harae]
MNHATLAALRERHPAWRLLASPHAPLVASFLYRKFVAPNVRVMNEADLSEALEDELFALREQLGEEAYPKGASEYLGGWCASDKGWLRKFYKPGTDEAQFDLTPAAEKAIAWLVSLTERPFVGTESRLLTLFALLEQISAGTEADPVKRVEELRRKRAELDAEISRTMAGEVPLLDDTAVKDRFQQFQQLARELLADFREVEHNFRQLDRKVRERIALWEGGKSALLDEIMGERDAIGDSDQGRSFRAFWDFLMSSRRQEQLSERLDQVLALPAVAALNPEPRTRRVHHDWLEAGEHAQRTVAQLHYWGDIDTHGFAILDQFRAHFPQAASLLMDQEMLRAHRLHWSEEPESRHHDLLRQTPDEVALYDDLRFDRFQSRLRLEQERVGFG